MPRSLSFLATLGLLAAAVATPLRTQTSPRLHTDREKGGTLLTLPKEEDAFGFVVFGDRTGGPVEGIEVLAQAVKDTNLLDPDLVFTVGDLINGYNGQNEWMDQAKEFKDTMAGLRMPWFPVAGNHDIYWRGKDKPAGEHETNYEAEFGPLWYAVQHKKCWFVALYTDEGNFETGEKNFSKPDCQRMSLEQLAWLTKTLEKAKDAPHVFVFLHHPRWLARYGDDWAKVHELLAAAGNVSAVFAGHIHRMRFDGVRDGIEYYTVASVGAHLPMEAPDAGYLHQYHVVTVRPEGISVAALPVGTVMDPKLITGDLSDEIGVLNSALKPTLTACVAAGGDQPVQGSGAVDAVVTLSYDNPTSRPIELEIVPTYAPGWSFRPDHQHLVVAPKSHGKTTFLVQRAASEPATAFELPKLETRCDYLAPHRRIGLPMREHTLELPAPADLGSIAAAGEGVLVLDGAGACLGIESDQLAMPQGPMTLELWLCGDAFDGRRAVLAKTEQSEFSLFCSDGRPAFSVYLDESYKTAEGTKGMLKTGQWHHLAGVYDGEEVRCYLDGALVARRPASGVRKTNAGPIFVGADPNGRGQPTSFFDGKVDEVRISSVARYQGDAFEVPARHEQDDDTVLLLHLDTDFGPWTPDTSGRGGHPRRRGKAHCTVESRPKLR